MDLQLIIQLLSQRLGEKPVILPDQTIYKSSQNVSSANGQSDARLIQKPSNLSVRSWLKQRQLNGTSASKYSQPVLTKRLPWLWSEFHWQTENLDKIFSCKWLDDNYALVGTKCHQLRLVDTRNQESHIIPIGSSAETLPQCDPMKPRGIHSISSNEHHLIKRDLLF